jgi:hypothetical protein
MKQKPILSEGTVRKFMKLANLGKVGEGFISEAYGQEEEKLEEGEEESLEEDKNFGGTKGHAMKPAPKAKKVMKEQEEEMGMDMDMPETPEVAPAEEPTEMDASSLADQIIQVLQGAGLVDVVEDEGEEEDMGDMGDEEMPNEGEEMPEDEEAVMESRKRQVAKIVAERVMNRIQKEQKVDRLAETITKRVMARMAGK